MGRLIPAGTGLGAYKRLSVHVEDIGCLRPAGRGRGPSASAPAPAPAPLEDRKTERAGGGGGMMKVRGRRLFAAPAVVPRRSACGSSVDGGTVGSGTAVRGGGRRRVTWPGAGGTMGTGRGRGGPADAATLVRRRSRFRPIRGLGPMPPRRCGSAGKVELLDLLPTTGAGCPSSAAAARRRSRTERHGRPGRRQSVPSSAVDGGAARVDAGGWTVIWDETGGDVGSHPTSWNTFAPSTMEQLLAECGVGPRADPRRTHSASSWMATCVPTTCTYFPSGCFDDCLVGITIVVLRLRARRRTDRYRGASRTGRRNGWRPRLLRRRLSVADVRMYP